MQRPRTGTQIAAVAGWAGLWLVVFVLDANFGHLLHWPALLIALFVLPQIALGYLIGLRALLCTLPLAAIWAPLAHANCEASGAECIPLGIVFIGAAELVLVWALGMALGHGLRIAVERRSKA